MTTTDETVTAEELAMLRAEHAKLHRKYGGMTDDEIDSYIELTIQTRVSEWLSSIGLAKMQDTLASRKAFTSSVPEIANKLEKLRERGISIVYYTDDIPTDHESLKKLVTNE